jgi:hypothetical protein
MKNLNNRFEMHLYQRMDNQLRIQLNWKIDKPLFEEIIHWLYHQNRNQLYWQLEVELRNQLKIQMKDGKSQ